MLACTPGLCYFRLKSIPMQKICIIISNAFFNENEIIPFRVSLKFVPRGPIDNKASTGSGNGLAPVRRQAISMN